jgi:hypothetical protein
LEASGGDTNSGREETSESSESESKEDSTSMEAERDAAVADYTFFTPQLLASAHLTTTPLTPTFGQQHAPIVMTPPPVHSDIVMDPTPSASAASAPVTELVPAPEPAPEVQIDMSGSDAIVTVSSSPEPAPQVELDVIGSDAVVTVPLSLLTVPTEQPSHAEVVTSDVFQPTKELEKVEVMDRASAFLK